MIAKTISLSLILAVSLSSFAAGGVDEDLVESLKIEAAHNMVRLRSFKTEVKNNRIFDEEREKALSEFLEEQEKWDLYRDRGLREYRAEKRKDSSPRVGGPEYNAYLEEKESEDARYERSRRMHVDTKRQFNSRNSEETISRLESEELGLYTDRPRYDLNRRASNKWVNSGLKTGGSGGFSGGSTTFQPPLPPPADFVPSPEFPAAPAPYEGFDESAQAPLPPPVFDSNNGGMTDGFMNPGGELNIPPPPPPPPDFDF